MKYIKSLMSLLIVFISVMFINVKATTEEILGFTGEKLGISASAVALIDNIMQK